MDRLLHLIALLFGAGVLGLLPFQSHTRIRVGFFQFVSALGCLSIILALRTPARTSVWAMVVLLIVALVHLTLVLTRRTEAAGKAAWLLPPTAAVAVVLEGWSLPATAADGGASVMAAASMIAGAGLLGSVTLALLLGHWYLYSPGLPVSHLKRLTMLTAAFVTARFLVFAACASAFARNTLAFPGAAAFESPPALDAEAFLASSLPLVSLRFLLGLLIPAVLVWMIDRTVRIRSTQAATGLLYVAFIFVLFGELTATYLVVLTGMPV